MRLSTQIDQIRLGSFIGGIEYLAKLSTALKPMILPYLTTPVKVGIGSKTCAPHTAINKRNLVVEIDAGTCLRAVIICANGIDGGLFDGSGFSILTTKRRIASKKRDISA